jgi:hypothetical protein
MIYALPILGYGEGGSIFNQISSNKNLCLFLINQPSLINRLKPIPGISDHKALFIDSDVQAKLRRPTSRKIFLWKKVDIEKLQNDMQAFSQSFISKFSTSHPVNSLWTTFKNGFLNVLGSNVPSKMTTEQYSQPWINQQIKQLTKRKQQSYNRYKKTIHSEYTIHGQVLNQTDSAKYLGLNIHNSLSWNSHIDKITKKANSTLAFLGVIIMILILVSEFREAVDWHVIIRWNHMVCMVNDMPPYCLGK